MSVPRRGRIIPSRRELMQKIHALEDTIRFQQDHHDMYCVVCNESREGGPLLTP